MIELRAARPTDAGSVGAILTEFATKTPWMPKLHTGAEDIAHAGALIERGWVTVAVEDDVVVGFTAFDPPDVDSLYLVSHARSRGIGTRLLDDLKARTDVLVLWTFQANTGARRFYETRGFEEVTRTDGERNDEQLPDIKYRWRREA